jgi:hypothetical protein
VVLCAFCLMGCNKSEFSCPTCFFLECCASNLFLLIMWVSEHHPQGYKVWNLEKKLFITSKFSYLSLQTHQ